MVPLTPIQWNILIDNWKKLILGQKMRSPQETAEKVEHKINRGEGKKT